MKKLILLLLVLGALQIQAQTVKLTRDKNNKELLQFQRQAAEYNAFLKAKTKAGHSYERERFNSKENVWEYGSACFCGGVEFSLPGVKKPETLVYLIPDSFLTVKRDTIVKYKQVVRRDTIPVVIVMRDTIQLPCREQVNLSDSGVLVKHTSIDKQTKLDYSVVPVVPYVEKRLYDYNGKYMGTVRVDPLTYEPLE